LQKTKHFFPRENGISFISAGNGIINLTKLKTSAALPPPPSLERDDAAMLEGQLPTPIHVSLGQLDVHSEPHHLEMDPEPVLEPIL
jgi:hypothetical protein